MNPVIAISLFRDAQDVIPQPRSLPLAGMIPLLAPSVPVVRQDLVDEAHRRGAVLEQAFQAVLSLETPPDWLRDHPWYRALEKEAWISSHRGPEIVEEVVRQKALQLGEALHRRVKARLPCWSPALYPQGATRGLEGVQAVSCLVLDYDDGTPIDEAVAPWVISNGPGDPAVVQTVIDTLRAVAGEVPTFGICLGHQLLALALGATTWKLKFGHRGANQPVRNLLTGRVEITSQNHGFCVDETSLRAAGGEPTHIHLNDGTLAGFRHTKKPIFSVQYHPEASPGPHDSAYLFDVFIEMMKSRKPIGAKEMESAQAALAAVARV